MDRKEFDLEQAIQTWRLPFQANVIYDREAMEELEDHLRVQVDQVAQLSEGDLKSAWAKALSLVGTEQDLRGEYLQLWTERPAVVKWWRSILSEGNPNSRFPVYRGLRLLSLCVGAFGVLVCVTFILAWITSVHLPRLRFQSDEYLHLQDAPIFVLTMVLTVLFNLTPFRAWSKAVDGLRGTVALGMGLLALHTAIIGIASQPEEMIMDAIEPFFWSTVVFLGPALWLVQLRWRGNPLSAQTHAAI